LSVLATLGGATLAGSFGLQGWFKPVLAVVGALLLVGGGFAVRMLPDFWYRNGLAAKGGAETCEGSLPEIDQLRRNVHDKPDRTW
jgi:hypothetical protein